MASHHQEGSPQQGTDLAGLADWYPNLILPGGLDVSLGIWGALGDNALRMCASVRQTFDLAQAMQVPIFGPRSWEIGVDVEDRTVEYHRQRLAERTGWTPDALGGYATYFRVPKSDPTVVTAEDIAAYEDLNEQRFSQRPSNEKVAWLSVGPNVMEKVLKLMDRALPLGSTIVVEKPQGTTLAQVLRICELARSLEEMGYVVLFMDHYFGKPTVMEEMVKRSGAERFGRRIKRIRRMWIVTDERRSFHGRHRFIDTVGALWDVFPSHLLSLYAVYTSPPGQLSDMPRRRAEALRRIPVLKPEQVAAQTRRLQYRGFTTEEGATPDAEGTETAFRITMEIGGVEVNFAAGKAMAQDFGYVVTEYEDGTVERINIQEDLQGALPTYGALVLAAALKRREFFLSADEVEAAAKVTAAISDAWVAGAVPLGRYGRGRLDWETELGLPAERH